MTVNHPQWGTMCEICFEQLTPDRCAQDEHGQRWDVCTGDCAVQAGIQERFPKIRSRFPRTVGNDTVALDSFEE